MAGKYIVTTEVGSKEKDEEKWWWDLLFDAKSEAEIFDSFEEATAAMRKKVTQLIKSCDSFPLKEGALVYEGGWAGLETMLEEEYDKFHSLNELVNRTLTDPNFTFSDFQDPFPPITDDGDRYYAFIADPGLVYVYYFEWELAFNIHDMRDPKKTYFFEYKEEHDDDSEKRISVRLIKTAG